MANRQKLVHVSLQNVAIENMKPQVPNNTLPREDKVTPRICLSQDICSAISSSTAGGTALLMAKTFKGYALLYVYEMIYTDDNSGIIIPPEVLFQKFHVADAIRWHEHWAIEPIKLKRKIYKINDAAVEINSALGDRSMFLRGDVKEIKLTELQKRPANTLENYLKNLVPRLYEKYGIKELLDASYNHLLETNMPISMTGESLNMIEFYLKNLELQNC